MNELKIQDLSVLILGAGVTGLASLEALYERAKRVDLYDDGDAEKLQAILGKYPNVTFYQESKPPVLADYDFLLKSPGILPGHPVVECARKEGLMVVSDVELAYRLFPDAFICGITGTNGKTTTTALLTHIAQIAGRTVHCLGNIGVGALPAFFDGGEDDLFVIELSSFQLADSPTLRARVAGILNLSPDHLNWHGTMESYIEAKSRIVLSQTKEDVAALNIDDPVLEALAQKAKSRVVPISLTKPVRGFYLEGDQCMRDGVFFFDFKNMRLPGAHNRQNALVAIAMAFAMGIDADSIREGLETFQGVAHRIEYVTEIDGVTFYNDSKGTNVDASIKAIEALPAPILLLAGGLDKKISYLPLIEAAKGKVSKLYLYGETKHLIEETAHEAGFLNTQTFEDLEGAVTTAFAQSNGGEIVLLSPASASWDMYPNFETRGEHFKEIVSKLGGSDGAQE